MAYRDNIDRLARRITDRIPVKFKKLKEDDPEYKCLSEILNDEQCNLCLFLEVRKPMSFEEILERTGWEEERNGVNLRSWLFFIAIFSYYKCIFVQM